MFVRIVSSRVLILILISAIAIAIYLRTVKSSVLERCQTLAAIKWDLFKCFFHQINFIKIIVIHNRTDGYRYLDVLSGSFLKQLHDHLEVPLLLLNYDFIEEIEFDYSMLFSWLQSKKFDLRPTQNESEMTVNQNKPSRWGDDHFGAIVIFDNIAALDEYFQGSVRKPFHTPDAQFIILLLSEIGKDESVAFEAIVKRMWIDYAILRVVFLQCGSLNLTYFDPFQRRYEHSELDYYNGWGEIVVEPFAHTSKICERCEPFYPRSMNSYPIKVVVFYNYPTALNWYELPESYKRSIQSIVSISGQLIRPNQTKTFETGLGGFDGVSFAHLAQAVSFQTYLNVLEGSLKYGFVRPNGEYEGAIRELVEGRAVISANPHFVRYYNTREITFLHPVMFDRFCVLVPKAPLIPQSWAFFLCFQHSTWALIITSYFGLAVLWYLMKRFLQSMLLAVSAVDFCRCVIDMLMVTTGTSLCNMHKLLTPERIYFFSIFALSIIVNGVFQSRLIDSFSHKWYQKDIDTLKELDESGLSIYYGSPSLKTVFGGNDSDDNPVLQSLTNKMVKKKRQEEAAEQEYDCSMVRKGDFNIAKIENLLKNGGPTIHMVPECPTVSHLSFLVRRGWPLFERFDRAISLYDSSGIRHQWYKATQHAKIVSISVEINKHITIHGIEPLRRPFNMEDVRIAFFILSYGYVFALIVLIIEFIVMFKNKKLRKK